MTDKEMTVKPDTANPYEGWNADLPEAGGVAWCDLYGVKNVQVSQEGEPLKIQHKVMKISLTSRAATPTQALDQLVEAIKEAKEKYQLFPYQ